MAGALALDHSALKLHRALFQPAALCVNLGNLQSQARELVLSLDMGDEKSAE